MRKIILLCCILVAVCPAAHPTHEQSKISLYGTIDALSVDALWQNALRFRLSVGSMVSEGVGFEIPVACTFDHSGGDEVLFDISLKLLVHPWGTGPYIGFTLTQLILFTGTHVPNEPIHYLNECVFGYTWEFAPRWFVRPSIIYRDPAESATESFAYITGLVPSWSRLQFSVDVGWVFASIATGGGR